MDLRIDVADALNQLEPLERKVIVAVVNNNETLEGFADQNGMAYTSLCRVYVRAKKKLQAALVEYA
jgi:DNA-directed RNA polymerase specialized sigma24 family protein